MESVLKHTELKIDKSNWKLVKFGDVVAEPKETCKDIVSEGIEHVVGLEHIDTGDLHLRKSATTEESTTFSKKFRKGDVLFGRRRAYLKKAAQADFDGICSGDITVFRAKNSLLPELLPFIVNNDKFFDFAVKHSAGGLSPRVKFKDLANYEFLLPPKAEQARLAEILWAMDVVIEKEKVVLEKLNSCLIALEFLYFDSYKKVSLKQVVQKTISGGTPSTKEKDFYKNGTIPWITTKTLNEDYTFFGEKLISHEAVQNSAAKILPKGNILAGTRVGVGKFSINDVDISFSQDINGLFIEKSLANVEYLLFQLNSKVFQKKLEPLLRGTTIKGILKDDLLNLKICLPEIKTQTENAMVITKNKKSILNLIEKITASQSLQKSLINMIF